MSEKTSAAFKMNTADLVEVAKNAALVGGAAALTYVVDNLASLELGSTGALFVPVIAVGLNTVISWMKDNSKAKTEE